jgi:hypothetical protein
MTATWTGIFSITSLLRTEPDSLCAARGPLRVCNSGSNLCKKQGLTVAFDRAVLRFSPIPLHSLHNPTCKGDLGGATIRPDTDGSPVNLFLVFPSLWRHHPADALPRNLLLAVVRSQISSPPSAHSATAAALDVLQNFFGLEAVNRQRALMMAGPIAFALAETIDKQLTNAVSADGGDSHRMLDHCFPHAHINTLAVCLASDLKGGA